MRPVLWEVRERQERRAGKVWVEHGGEAGQEL
jgi:hypothetical protein